MSDKLKLYIRGEGQLARATTVCCLRHFEIVTDPRIADIFWVCHDTLVNSLDESNVNVIFDDIRPLLAELPETVLVLISSQLPVGSTAIMEEEFPTLNFACSPENIRVATGIADFESQARIVVGARPLTMDRRLDELFHPFTQRIIYTETETAEMVKHALNGFLAVSIAYINEVATLCRIVGADPKTVADCVKLDPRVGEKARLNPGAPYSGGTLARDVYTMARLGKRMTPLIAAIKPSNDRDLR